MYIINCWGIVLLLACSFPLRGQVYADLYMGLHPQVVNDGGASTNVNFALGRQVSPAVGYGLNLGGMTLFSVSTTSSFSTLGLQYRWLNNQSKRVFTKAEFGSLIGANYTTDGPLSYEYQAEFNPYFRTYLGYRLGRFVLGCNYTYIAPFSERIYAYDDTIREYLPTANYRTRNLHDLQLYFGIMLDAFKPGRRD